MWSGFAAAALVALCAACAACAVAPDVTVSDFPAAAVKKPPPPGAFGLEERFARGQYLEIQRFLEGLPRAALEKNALQLSLYGRVLLARGDFETAWPILEKARALESRAARRAEIEWALSQGALLWNDFASAHDYAESAVRDGYGLVPGFLNFLAAMRDVDAYAGPPIGETHAVDFNMSGFDLIRIPASINGLDTVAIVDSGAVYSIVTESFARQAGVREIPDSKASGRGLHKREFPVTFGVLDRLEFAGISMTGVPVMLMPDEALLFETTRGPLGVPAVIGLHLLKELTADIDYRGRNLRFTRTNFRVPKRDSGQNLFFNRGRVFVRSAINGNGFYQFLLDTGSEPTMMTTAGLMRAGLPASNRLFPKKVYGIGKTQVEWGRVREVSIGLSGFDTRFKDLVVKEDDSSFEDGIVGTSYLKHFRVRIDYSRMVLSLERGR